MSEAVCMGRATRGTHLPPGARRFERARRRTRPCLRLLGPRACERRVRSICMAPPARPVSSCHREANCGERMSTLGSGSMAAPADIRVLGHPPGTWSEAPYANIRATDLRAVSSARGASGRQPRQACVAHKVVRAGIRPGNGRLCDAPCPARCYAAGLCFGRSSSGNDRARCSCFGPRARVAPPRPTGFDRVGSRRD